MSFKPHNENSLVNFSNSFLKHFNVPTFHQSIPEIDQVLVGHQKIVVMLFDGMGRNIIQKHLDANSFIRSHRIMTINSTFPPTTAAATTAFLSGKYPKETGWLAWDVYLKEYQKNVILFTGVDYNTDEKIAGLNRKKIESLFPYTNITDLIHTYNENVYTKLILRYPIQKYGPRTLRGSLTQLNNILKRYKRCFIYYYFDSPDREMHINGIDNKIITNKVKEVEEFIKQVTTYNPDTIFFSFADHGHVDTKYLNLNDHPDLMKLLVKPVSFEKRSSMFFVNKAKLDDFASLFNKYYGEEFTLISREQIIKDNVFGLGKEHPQFLEMIGDYLATSNGGYALVAMNEFKEPQLFPGHHAGGTKEEREIDISVFNCK